MTLTFENKFNVGNYGFTNEEIQSRKKLIP